MASRIHLDETVERSLQDVLITSTTAVVVSSHAVDLPVVERLLASPACYVGLLGSRHKARTMIQALEASGLDEASMGKLFVPIGWISAGSSAEIAVGVVAEIMLVLHPGPRWSFCGAIPPIWPLTLLVGVRCVGWVPTAKTHNDPAIT
jgi:xanthine dehydrogenase accessory factor